MYLQVKASSLDSDDADDAMPLTKLVFKIAEDCSAVQNEKYIFSFCTAEVQPNSGTCGLMS